MANTELRQKHDIFLWITGTKKLILFSNIHIDIQQIRITDSNDQIREVESIQYVDNKYLISVKDKLNFTNNYYIEFGSRKIPAFFSRSILNKFFYYQGSDLGARFKKQDIIIKFWSPPATKVIINIFKQNSNVKIIEKKLARRENGIWYGRISPQMVGFSSLDGLSYTLDVTAHNQTKTVLDPYALSMASFNPSGDDKVGKGAFINLDRVDKIKVKKIKRGGDTDFIAYETHIRDFTIDPELDIPNKLKGTYRGFELVIPKIAELGVTHLQLMPLQNFYTVDEDKKVFQGIEAATEDINFNWGYDPHHFFTPEGWFSSNPNDPYSRLNELVALVKSVHKNQMGVILDVVYNHVFEYSTLDSGAPGCYFRRNQLGDVSFKTGAGPSLESRSKMVRQLIINSLLHYVETFGINGFRFDLMNFLDHETMKNIRRSLGKDIILYGEAWSFTDLPHEIATTKTNLPTGINLAVFNDSSRDSYTGRMSSRGYIQGAYYEAPKVRAGIIGAIQDFTLDSKEINNEPYVRFASRPGETINYLSIHDGFTLWDKINLSTKGDKVYREQLIRNALGLLFTSQGKIILHGGIELGRSKPLLSNDPNPHRAHTSEHVDVENGISYFHENTYKSPDFTNMIDWSRQEQFNSLKKYLKGLIKLRRSLPALRFEKLESIQQGLQFVGKSNLKQKDSPRYLSFDDQSLKKLKLKFINAPASIRGKTVFLVGEIHSRAECPDPLKNPLNNRFILSINDNGIGEIILNRSDLDGLDLRAWSDTKNMQLKLVRTEGGWDFPQESYSNWGNNTITPESITSRGIAVIDLSIRDYRSGQGISGNQKQISYILDNTLENAYGTGLKTLDYSKVFVTHNVSPQNYTFNLNSISETGKWDILVDGVSAGIIPILDSKVIIEDNFVIIPAHSSVVLAK